MRSIRALAPAKVNLTFDIIGDLPDGYHQVETLLQAIDLQDELIVKVHEANEFCTSITCLNDVVPAHFPLDDSNLMAKAARMYCQRAGVGLNWSIDIDIEKNIPVGAGLAGGSTDAAAMLAALNKLFDDRLSEEELLALGASLGADVPFCLTGGTCVGTGRGDKLRPVDCNIMFAFCIIKPRKLHVATPWAYKQFDEYKGSLKRPNLPEAEASLQSGDIDRAIASFGNVFEPVIFEAMPELVSVKDQLLKRGCWYCQLSGSGPAIFGLVADREQAHYIRRKILKTDDLEFDYIRLPMPDLGPPLECYIAQTLSNGITLLPHVVQVN